MVGEFFQPKGQTLYRSSLFGAVHVHTAAYIVSAPGFKSCPGADFTFFLFNLPPQVLADNGQFSVVNVHSVVSVKIWLQNAREIHLLLLS